MKQKQELKQELTTTRSMKLLTTAYQQHALEQINLARYSVVASRDFAHELTTIFANVRASYEHLLTQLMQHDKNELEELRKKMKNGKEVMVLVSANNKLYGELIPKICRLFVEQAKTSSADLVIIGKDGRNFVRQAGLKRNYTYFELPDTNIKEEDIARLTGFLLPYSNVLLFCGKFNNIISQEAIMASLTGEELLSEKAQPTNNPKPHDYDFLFEPSIEYVMNFFESQIFSIILSQTVSEARLARFGSRVRAMETAQNNFQKNLIQLLKEQRKLKSIEMNKKQLELFAGRRLWGRR